MSDGELKCYETSLDLKNKFGIDYRLTCFKDDGCESTAITQLLSEYISKPKICGDNENELTYVLPNDCTWKFEKIFRQLEEHRIALKLKNFVVAIKTLEEVFFKTSLHSTNELSNQHIVPMPTPETGSSTNTGHSVCSFDLFVNQCIAMFKKKFSLWKRKRILILIQISLQIWSFHLIPETSLSFEFAVCFISSFYIVFYIEERVSGAKNLQFVSGLNVSTFWAISSLFDMFALSLTTLVSIIFIFSFNVLKSIDRNVNFFIICLIVHLSSLLNGYVLSFFFSSSAQGFVWINIIFLGLPG